MAKLGNPFSLPLGGTPSPEELVYAALRDAVGEGNSTPGHYEDSIMESWRWARANGLAAVVEDKRAVTQNWPFLATDLLPMYEQLLRRGFPLTTSDEEKRVVLTAVWTREIDSTIPGLEAALQEIEPSLSILIPDHDLVRETQFGRAFEDWDVLDALASGPAFNLDGGTVGSNATAYPNYSDDYLFFVLYPLPAGFTISESQRLILKRIEDLMNEAMPAWCDQRTFTTGSGVGQACGFILDQDQLDLTVFCT